MPNFLGQLTRASLLITIIFIVSLLLVTVNPFDSTTDSKPPIITLNNVEKLELLDVIEIENGVSDFTISPDSSLIAIESSGGVVQVWEIAARRQLVEFFDYNGDSDVLSMIFHPNSNQLLTQIKPDYFDFKVSVYLWDILRNREVIDLMPPVPLSENTIIWDVAFSPSGSDLVLSASRLNISTGFDDYIVNLWSINDWAVQRLPTELRCSGFVFTADTLVGECGHLQIWERETGKLVAISEDSINAYNIAINPTQSSLVTWGESNLEIWDLETLSITATLNHNDRINDVAFSPDGSQIASVSSDHMVRLWDTESGELSFEFQGHTDDLLSISFNSDGTILASSGRDGRVMLWNTENGELITTSNPYRRIWTAKFTPDGRLLVLRRSRSIQFWGIPPN